LKRCLCTLLFLAGCSDPSPRVTETVPQDHPLLTDHTEASGVDFTWHSGASGSYYMPEIIGGGGGLFDADDDGDLDLYLVQGGHIASDGPHGLPDTFMRNDGNGTYTRSPIGVDLTDYGMGVATGDVDNDGDVDLYVLNLGTNRLLLNNGNGTFTDGTALSGTGDAGWSAAAAFLDHDHDGDLDLFVVNYLAWTPASAIDCSDSTGAPEYCSPDNFKAPTVDRLFRNDGNGRFTDITTAAGINAKPGTGLGIVAVDFDRDGYQDVFVANDLMPDHLWHNNGDGTFSEIAMQTGCAMDDEGKAKAGMGVDATDIDNDGDLDLIVCNLKNESDSFFRNDGDYFVDITSKAGLRSATRVNTRFGLGFVDFDNDGHLDLYEANGAVLRPAHLPDGDPYAQRNLLLLGGADGRFRATALRGSVDNHQAMSSRGAIFGDIDNDGRMDVIVINRDAPARVYRNTATPRNWITFDVRNDYGAPALGNILEVTVDGNTITRPVKSAWSYMTANDPRVHIGLGQSTEATDVKITQPDGLYWAIPGRFEPNQIHRVDRPKPTGTK